MVDYFLNQRRVTLIIKLKAIKSRENIISYLSSYFHHLRPQFFYSCSISHHHHHWHKPLYNLQTIKLSSCCFFCLSRLAIGSSASH